MMKPILLFSTQPMVCMINGKSVRDRKPIFQSVPHVHISLVQARDAYEMQKSIPKHLTRRVYEEFSIDGEMVDKYIDVVEKLERTYKRDQNIFHRFMKYLIQNKK